MGTTRTSRSFTSALLLPALLLAAALGLFSSPSSTFAKPQKGNPNIDCPAGTTLVAKFNWDGSYVFEKPAGNEGAVTISGNATSGSWTSTTPIGAVILKGGTGTYTYDAGGATSGSFTKEDLPLNNGGQRPAISNIQFCGGGTPPPAGSLEVTKNVDWNGHDTYEVTFEFCITGPSYPSGNCKTLTFSGSTGTTQSVTWSDLAPGNYTVTENFPNNDEGWEVTGSGQVVAVAAGATAHATITNRCVFEG